MDRREGGIEEERRKEMEGRGRMEVRAKWGQAALGALGKDSARQRYWGKCCPVTQPSGGTEKPGFTEGKRKAGSPGPGIRPNPK